MRRAHRVYFDRTLQLLSQATRRDPIMRIAYLDCLSGISGDMTLAALVDAGVPLAEVQAGLDSLGIAGLRLETNEVKKKGFRALKLTIHHEPEHAHRHVHHITEMIDRSSLTARQKERAAKIFEKLAAAEAKVHGSTIEKVHFHEVGAVDSIADIVGAAIGFDLLDIERVICSPRLGRSVLCGSTPLSVVGVV